MSWKAFYCLTIVTCVLSHDPDKQFVQGKAAAKCILLR